MTTADWLALLGRVTTTWGGPVSTMYFPIDDWQRGGIWDDLIHIFDADYFYLPPSGRGLENTLERRYAPLGVVYDEELLDPLGGPLRCPSSVDLVDILAIRGWERLSSTGALTSPVVAHFLHLATGMTDSLTIAAAQHLGVLTVADLKRIDNMVPRGTVSIVPNTFRFDQDGTGALEHMEFLIGPNEGWIAGVNVERFASWETRPNGWSDMPLVVAGNAQADICLWLTLKSLRWSPEESAHGPCSVYWIPDDVLTDETFNADVPSAYLQRIVGGLTGAVAVVSASLDGEGARERWTRLEPFHTASLRPVFDQPFKRLFAVRRFPFIDTVAKSVKEQFWRRLSVGSATVALPPWLRDYTGDAVHFLTDFQIERFTAPTHGAACPIVRAEPSVAHRPMARGVTADMLHVERHRGMRISDDIVPVQLELPDVNAILDRYAKSLGGAVSLSGSGLIARQVLTKFDSLSEAVRRLRTGPLRLLADEFREPVAPIGSLALRDRCYLRPEAIAHILSNALSKSQIESELGDLVRRGILTYGLALRCPHCSLSAFYPWQSIDHTGVRCSQCTHLFVPAPDVACGWCPVAQLNELVFRVYEDHLLEELTLAAWLQLQSDSGLIAIGAMWELPKLSVETDVIAIVEGELCIAEAKSTNDATKKQICRLGELANRLEARRLIFATSQSAWLPGVAGRLTALRSNFPGVDIELYSDLLRASVPTYCPLDILD